MVNIVKFSSLINFFKFNIYYFSRSIQSLSNKVCVHLEFVIIYFSLRSHLFYNTINNLNRNVIDIFSDLKQFDLSLSKLFQVHSTKQSFKIKLLHGFFKTILLQ